MTPNDLVSLLALVRKRTLALLDSIAETPDPARVLGWRPGPGRAHIAWQLMHVAATDDRHLNVRMLSGTVAEPDTVRRFAGGSVPDDDIPTLDAIRRYLEQRRTALLEHLRSLTTEDLDRKPTPDAQWPYGEWFQVLAWHEAHHHGQVQLTFNLYRAENDPSLAKTGH